MNTSGHNGKTNAARVAAAVTCLMAVCPAAVADWLDVVAEDIRVVNTRTGEAGTTVAAQAGDTLQIICTEWIGLTAGHDLWETSTVQHWENRVTIDGQVLGVFNPTIPPGTIIGSSTGSSGFLGLGGSSSKKGVAQIRNVYPPVNWVADGIGNHEASCVLNQPKQISDNSATNNIIRGLIVVSAAAPAAEPEGQQAPAAPPVFATVVEPGAVPETATADRMAAPRAAQPQSVTDETALPPATSAGAATEIMKGVSAEAAAPPNPCSLQVTFYVPQPPVVETSSESLQVGDQVRIRCAFEKKVQQLEWLQCDDEAKSTMRSLKFNQESGSRYSGMMIIDDANIGVVTSPEDGASFDNTGVWIFNEAGSHEVACQVDNGLHVAGNDSPVHLQAGASLQVGGSSGSQEFRAFEPAAARQVTVAPQPVQTAPLARDGNARLTGGDAAFGGNGGVVNPALNPQPEVPSRRLDREDALAAPVPLPDPPTANPGNPVQDKFTGSGGQESSRSFDPQSRYTGVRQSQGAVVLDDDLNEAAAGGAAVAQPAGQSGGRQILPQPPGAVGSDATATPWERIVMTCIPLPVQGPAIAGTLKSYEVWGENSSSGEILSGRRIQWRLYGATVPSSKFAGASTEWTEDGTYDLQSTLAVGARVKVASTYVNGNVTGCEVWAQ